MKHCGLRHRLGILALSAVLAAGSGFTPLSAAAADSFSSDSFDLSGLWDAGNNPYSYLWMEAENGSLSPGIKRDDHLEISEASGRNLISGNQYIIGTAETNEETAAVYNFCISEEGSYNIWVRTLLPNTASDSFSLCIDELEAKGFSAQLTNFTWKNISEASLTAGNHTLRLFHPDEGAVIDKILLTNDKGYVPKGIGQMEPSAQSDFAPPVLSTFALSVQKSGAQDALLTWQPGTDDTGIAKYQVYINGSLYTETKGTDTQVHIGGLQPGKSYQAVLKAVDLAGKASRQNSQITIYTVSESKKPKAIQNLTAEGGNTRVTLSWTPPQDEITLKYVIMRNGTQIALIDAETGIYEDKALPCGVLYDYTVVPVSISGDTGAAQNVSARVNPYINVCQAPYFAKGDGKTDDTQALQAALHDWSGKTAYIYIPDGTYLLSNYLEFSDYVKSAKRLMVVGESQENTILKWKDNLPQYADSENPQPMLNPYSGPEGQAGDGARDEINYQAFHNSVRNLTIDSGKGNPGAIAVRWTNNNTGGLENVTIRSGDGQGQTGLDLTKQWTGPGYMKNLTIEGFDVGIRAANDVYNMVFEDLTLKNQNVCGIFNCDYPLTIRNMTSINQVPAIWNEDSPLETEFDGDTVISSRDTTSMVTLIDAVLSGGAEGAAIENIRGAVFLRNVTADGYPQVLNDQGTNIDGQYIEEYSTLPVSSAFENSAKTSLNLPMEDTPALSLTSTEAAASPDAAYVTDYGAIPGDGVDDTTGIQKAIDSGKKYIIFPNGTYNLADTVYIRENVNAMIGFEAVINIDGTEADHQFANAEDGVFQICQTNSPFVLFENFSFSGGYLGCPYFFVHTVPQTLVIRHTANHSSAANCSTYINTVPGGTIFADDTSLPVWILNGQTMYARQFNPEKQKMKAKVINTGGDLVILGYKAEGNATEIISEKGAKTEILGGSLYPASGRPERYRPAFVCDESMLSVNLIEAVGGQDPVRSWELWFRETRNGETRDVTEDMLPRRVIVGSAVGLYAGYQTECVLDSIQINGQEYPYFAFYQLNQTLPLPADTTAPPVLTATACNPDAAVTIKQAASLSDTASVTVEENGKTQTYTFSFGADNNAALETIAIDTDGKGTPLLTPAELLNFDPEKTSYAFYVTQQEDGSYPIPQVTAAAQSEKASVTIQQAESIPGTASVTVTAEDGVTVRQYTVEMLPADFSNASLKSLRVWNNYFLDFDPNVHEYFFPLYKGQLSTVPGAMAAEAQNGNAQVVVQNPTTLNGTGTITVTSADQSNTQTYTVHFTAEDNNARLKNLLINGTPLSGFDPDTTQYFMAFSEDTTVTASAFSDSAQVQIEYEEDKITVTVTPDHGLYKKVYIVYNESIK